MLIHRKHQHPYTTHLQIAATLSKVIENTFTCDVSKTITITTVQSDQVNCAFGGGATIAFMRKNASLSLNFLVRFFGYSYK